MTLLQIILIAQVGIFIVLLGILCVLWDLSQKGGN